MGSFASAPVLEAFARVAKERLGLSRIARQPAALKHRLHQAMALAGAADAAEYVARLDRAGEQSMVLGSAADALANGETWFFRDVGQLEALARELLPGLLGAPPWRGPLRVLSAGCSTGEEVYSLSMLALDELHRFWGRGVEVVGLDLSPRSVESARLGRYPEKALARGGRGPPGWQDRYFRRDEEGLQARPFLKAMTSFVRGNLLCRESLGTLGVFDAVICRNVLIYFEGAELLRALSTLEALVRPGGVLVLGQPESGAVTSPGLAWQRDDERVWFVREGQAA